MKSRSFLHSVVNTRHPVRLITNAILHLDILEYLAWESRFFTAYIGTFRHSPKSQATTSGSRIRPTSPIPPEPDADDEGDTGGNIWTEFETGEDRPTPPVSHPWMLELRVTTANVHLLGRLPPLSFSCMVIGYGGALKAWRELVHELFPNHDEEQEVLRNLDKVGDNRNPKYMIFRANGHELVFRGEALLGCLYTLARTKHQLGISPVSGAMLTSAGEQA